MRVHVYVYVGSRAQGLGWEMQMEINACTYVYLSQIYVWGSIGFEFVRVEEREDKEGVQVEPSCEDALFYLAGKSFFLNIYEVITWEKLKEKLC